MWLAVITGCALLLGVDDIPAEEHTQIQERIKIGSDTEFVIRGKNRDGIGIMKNGKLIWEDRLWNPNNAQNPGSLKNTR